MLEPLSCGTLGVWLRTPPLRPWGRCTELQRPTLVSLGRGPEYRRPAASCARAQATGPAVLMSGSVGRGEAGWGQARGEEPGAPQGKSERTGPEVPGLALEEGSAVERV